MSQIQIRTFENRWGGVSIFQKCLNYKLLSDPILTRTELPSCEAIDVRKVNIDSIVNPVTKCYAGTNLKVHTEFKAGIKHKVGTIIKVYTDFKAGTNFKSGTIFKVGTNLKIVLT